jgi:WD40 repeat protein
VALSDPGVCVVDFPRGQSRQVLAADGAWSRTVFTADGRLLLAGSPNGRISLWDTSSGRLVRHFEDDMARVTSLDLMHGRAVLASGAEDGTVRIWDLKQTRR